MSKSVFHCAMAVLSSLQQKLCNRKAYNLYHLILHRKIMLTPILLCMFHVSFQYAHLPWFCHRLISIFQKFTEDGQRHSIPKFATRHTDYCELKLFEKQSVQEEHSNPPLFPLKTRNRLPMWKVPSLHEEVERHSYCQRERECRAKEIV